MDGLQAGQCKSRGPRVAAGQPLQLLMPVLLLAIAGAMAAEPCAGTRSWPTVNATSSAAGDDGFAKSATQTLVLATLIVAKSCTGDQGTHVCRYALAFYRRQALLKHI